MTQSQTSAFMSSSFPYGGPTKGLSIREREREAARIERERQLQNAEPVSLSAPLFPHPKKVQPSSGDRLKSTIQATLGNFNDLAPSMSHQKQYSLLGITNKVPQTPVDAGANKVFSFENNSFTKKENTPDKKLAKNPKMKPLNRTKDEKHRNDLKTTSSKKTLDVDQHGKTSTKTVNINKKVSDTDHHSMESPLLKNIKDNKVVSVKKESSSSSNEVPKQDQEVIQNGIDEKIPNVKKDAKDTTTKHKPPKLSIKTRSPEHLPASSELSQPNVKKILEEMTQPGPPPLTAIQTPRKNNAQFAFPHMLVPSSLSNGSPAAATTVKNEKEEQNLLGDLHMSDDEGNDSSDDSDSSSGSDSDSSSDNSPPNSPVRSKLNRPTKSNKLNHADKETAIKSHLPSATLASTTSSLSDTGEGGVRGNLAAPAAHTSPLNNASVNNESNSNHLSLLADFGLELPDISKTIFEEGGEDNGFNTAVLTNDISLCDEDPVNHFKPIENSIEQHSTEVEEKELPLNTSIKKETSLTTSSKKETSLNASPKRETLLNTSPKRETLLTTSPKKEHLFNTSPKKETLLNTSPKKELSLNTSPKKETSLNTSPKKESSLNTSPKKETSLNTFPKKEPTLNKSPKEVEKVKKEKIKGEAVTSKSSKEKHSKSSIKRKASDSVNIKSSSKNNDSKDDTKAKKVEKSSEKKAIKTKKSSSSKVTKLTTSDGENEEIDVVTVSSDKPLLNKTNSVENKHNKTESKSKVKQVNGHKETALNGHSNSSMNGHKDSLSNDQKEVLSPLSPKNGVEEITLHSKPDALVVKIPLAWLKRIPLLNKQDSLTLSTKIENGKYSDHESSPPRKAAKHHLSVECTDGKKPKNENTMNGELKESRHNSTSSTHDDNNRRKRSPSRESDRYYNKRRRHDSENSKHENEREKNGHSKINGWNRMKGPKSPQEHGDDCFCDGKKEADKRQAWIAKLYDPEARVPHGPDYYLLEAKRVKHHADAIKDHTLKAYKYFESVLSFVNCGKALEQKNDTESRSAYQMYVETIEMLKYAMRLSASKSSQEKKVDKRFIGLCLRLQSLLYMRLFKLRKDSMLKASKNLMDHFKGQAKHAQAPSPYNASTNKTTGTPSPVSPTPSPSGSIGSVGSVGSVGSSEVMTTPSRTGNRPLTNCMTSPVNTTIPQKVHTMTLQHLGFTNHMLYGYDTWEQSQTIFNEHREFFMDLDRNYGPITLQSPILDVVEYVRQGYQRLQET